MQEPKQTNHQNVMRNLKSRKFTAYALILAALALAVAIPLNLIAGRLDVIWDMTPAKMYEVTDTTKEYLASLDKQVDLYFLMDMSNLEDETSTMALYRCLQTYEACDHINFKAFDPDTDPTLTDELNSRGYQLSRGDIVVECEGRSKHVAANTMYETSYEYDEEGNAKQVSDVFTGENYITGAIDAVVSGRDTIIYFLTGHGEKSLENDYTKFTSVLANRNYAVRELNLATEEMVPDDAAMVVLAGPKSDLSNDETRKLNAFLDEGGNVCFWMSPNEAETTYPNIVSVLGDFGIGMDYDRVCETDAGLHITNDPYTFRVSVVRSEEGIDLTSELEDVINEGIVPFMSETRSFYPTMTAEDTSLQYGSLLQTVAATDTLGNTVSSAVGEAYGGGAKEDITGQVLDLAMFSTSTLRKDAKVMVMGNAEFIDDTNVQQDYVIVPVNLMLSVISWMYDSTLDMDMGIADRGRSLDSLRLNSESEANRAVAAFTIAPIAVALVGVGVWLKRRYS